MYSELLKLFDVREVANLVHDALGSLPTVMHGDESLQAVKLQSIGKTVESHLYTNPGKVAMGCLQYKSAGIEGNHAPHNSASQVTVL